MLSLVVVAAACVRTETHLARAGAARRAASEGAAVPARAETTRDCMSAVIGRVCGRAVGDGGAMKVRRRELRNDGGVVGVVALFPKKKR